MANVKIPTIPLLAVLLCLGASCTEPTLLPGGSSRMPERKWTLLVYMNADNDLEAQGLRDLNEMEAAATEGVEILALLDRTAGYDSGDGDWTGTRLYRVKADPGGINYSLVSERLACPGLGLAASGDDSELNLGAPGVLSAFIDFGKENYPAHRTMVILWGHGAGWRSPSEGPPAERESSYKASSFDDSDADFLYTVELKQGLDGRMVDILAFDTCSSMLLEVAYEVRACASYMAGSEDVISSEGWNYQKMIAGLSGSDGSVLEAGRVLRDSFAEGYQSAAGATFSFLDLSKVAGIVTAIDSFVEDREAEAEVSGDAAGYYSTLKTSIFDDVEDFYTTPGDLNIDVAHLGEIVEGPASPLKAAVEEAVVYSFCSSSGNPNAKGLAVHFVPLGDTGFVLSHNDAYFKDKVAGYSLAFVADSKWCPDATNASGFLWKLFY